MSPSSSSDYYYVETSGSVGKIQEYFRDPRVVEIRRGGRPHKVRSISSSDHKHKAVRSRSRSRSRSISSAGGKGKKRCNVPCIIGWILALIFFILFIGFLVTWMNSSDDLESTPSDDLESTTSTSTATATGTATATATATETATETAVNDTTAAAGSYFAGWPEIDSTFASRDPAEIDDEEIFIEDILAQLTITEMILQMIQPGLNYSDSIVMQQQGEKFGPGDVEEYPVGSMLSGGGDWPDSKYNYAGLKSDNGNGTYGPNSVFACPGCVGFKSTPDAYARFIEEFHIANERYWANRTFRIPFFYATDAVHGHNNAYQSTLFPHNVGLGAANNPDLMMAIGAATAKEVTATGMDWTFAPAVSVPRNEAWGRVYEGYSEDPSIVYKYSEKMVHGIQGSEPSDLKTDDKVISNIKHWVGDGGTYQGIDHGDNRYSEEDLINIHGHGYFSGLNAGAQVVKVSFSSWINTANYDPVDDDGLVYNGKLHGSPYIINEVLKDKMGFDGIVVTDWLGHTEIPGCTKTSCDQMINAGVDVVTIPGGMDWKLFADNLEKSVMNNFVAPERIEDAVRRILRVKYRAGLFHRPSPLGVACNLPDADTGLCTEQCSFTVDGTLDSWYADGISSPSGSVCGRANAGSPDILGSDDHMEIARQAVRESLVLLKNNDAALPITTKTPTIGFLGSAAKDWSKVNGGWTLSWQGGVSDHVVTSIEDPATCDFEHAIHPSHAILAAAGKKDFSDTQEGCLVDEDDTLTLDYCFILIGEDPYAEMLGDVKRGQTMMWSQMTYNYSLDSLLLQQQRDIINIALSYNMKPKTKIVTIFFSGRALYVNNELNNSDAFIAAFLPGSAGMGFVDVMFDNGNEPYDFVGRLPRTWPLEPCHADVRSHPSTLNDDWVSPPFERGYDEIGEGEIAPLEIGWGLSYANPMMIEDYETPDRTSGCYAPDVTDVETPGEDIDLSQGTTLLCSAYENQYDVNVMQKPCGCFVASPDASLDCDDVPDYSALFSVTESPPGTYQMVVGANASSGTRTPQMYLLLDSPKDVAAYFKNAATDTGSILNGWLSFTLKADTNPGDEQIGIGVAFGDGSASFERSDRSYFDLADEIDNHTGAANGKEYSLDLECFNGQGGFRNWYELAQSLIFETRRPGTYTISNLTLKMDKGDPDLLVGCDDKVDDLTKTYLSYKAWNDRAKLV